MNDVRWHPDARHVLSASWDCQLKIWDVVSAACVKTVTVSNAQGFTCAQFSLNGAYIAAASCDETVILFDAESSRVKSVLKGHSSVVTSVDISRDGRKIISSSYGASLQVRCCR